MTYPDHLRANLGNGFILSKRDIREKRPMAGDGRVCVALNVGAPFPACRVWVTSADVFRLEALEFLLGAEFVGLTLCQHAIFVIWDWKRRTMLLDIRDGCLLADERMRRDRETMKVDATDKIGRLGMCITPGHVQQCLLS